MTAGGARALAAFLTGGDAGQTEASREIVETLPVAIYATDADGRLTYSIRWIRQIISCPT